ncbi:hypothetical protein Acr_24g0009690 [Actinidia rufa]|uniref:Uncharacterized protein n=1 Tax=Actinidia rufa TaxID=165716 RepID=A0A7J0GVA2_9ERIC|nr:hypothetical protein Acr_24g0009690 [Actinidia rufa]
MIPSMIYLAVKEIQHIANATEELDGFKESTTTDDEVPGDGGAGVADGEDQRPYGGTEKLLAVKMSRAAMVAVAVDGSSRERGRRSAEGLKRRTQTWINFQILAPIAWRRARRQADTVVSKTHEAEKRDMDRQLNCVLESMKEKSGTVDGLVGRTSLSFITEVMAEPLQSKFKIPQMEAFVGTKDPMVHLERAFPTTLKGSARIWFGKLKVCFIGTFAQPSKLLFNLAKSLSASMAEMMMKTQKYMNAEDAMNARREDVDEKEKGRAQKRKFESKHAYSRSRERFSRNLEVHERRPPQLLGLFTRRLGLDLGVTRHQNRTSRVEEDWVRIRSNRWSGRVGSGRAKFGRIRIGLDENGRF